MPGILDAVANGSDVATIGEARDKIARLENRLDAAKIEDARRGERGELLASFLGAKAGGKLLPALFPSLEGLIFPAQVVLSVWGIKEGLEASNPRSAAWFGAGLGSVDPLVDKLVEATAGVLEKFTNKGKKG